MSCQPRPQFQATGIAARMARNGTAMKATRATCSNWPLRSNWGFCPTCSTDVESPWIEVSVAGGLSGRRLTAAMRVPGVEVVTDVSFGGDETYASVTFDFVGCRGSATIARASSRSTTLALAPRRRVVPRLVCWQGPPDFESGLATKVRFLPGELIGTHPETEAVDWLRLRARTRSLEATTPASCAPGAGAAVRGREPPAGDG